jgi:hypothetical protein
MAIDIDRYHTVHARRSFLVHSARDRFDDLA